MAGKERSRRRLDDRVEEVLAVDQGRGPAGGLADLATRRDAEALACAARRDRSDELDRRLERRFDHIDDLFDRLTAEIIAAIRSELAAAGLSSPGRLAARSSACCCPSRPCWWW